MKKIMVPIEHDLYKECIEKQTWCSKDHPCILIVFGACKGCSYFKK